MRQSFTALLMAMLYNLGVGAATTVVPPEAGNTEGAGYSTTLASIGRQQNIYDSSMFPPGPILIDGLWFRPDAIGGPVAGVPFSATISNLQILLATTTKTPNSQSMNFAANLGSDSNTVFAGPLKLSSAATGASGGSKAFDIFIPFQSAFLYDPSKGNLVVDFKNFSGGQIAICDGTGPNPKASRNYSAAPGAVTADGRDNGADVLRFSYQIAYGRLRNGSFEIGFNGWSQVGSNAITGLGPGGATISTDGLHAAVIGAADVKNSSISQVVTILGGATYLLRFDWFADAFGSPGKAGKLSVNIKDSQFRTLANQLFTNITAALPSGGSLNFRPDAVTYNTLPDSGAVTITFSDATDDGGVGLDILLDDVLLSSSPNSLISNGSFEANLTGWTTAGFSTVLGPAGNGYAVGTEGSNALALGANASVFQTVNLPGGTNFDLTFDWFADAAGIAGNTGQLTLSAIDSKSRTLAKAEFSSVSTSAPKNGGQNFHAAKLAFRTFPDSGGVRLAFAAASSSNAGLSLVIDNIVVLPSDATRHLPPVSAATHGSPYSVDISFGQPISDANLTDPASYSIDQGLMVAGATRLNSTTVRLWTTLMDDARQYVLTLRGLHARDRAEIVVAPNSQLSFAPSLKADLVRRQFNERFYVSAYPDVQSAVQNRAFASGLEHFLRFGLLEGRAPNPLFNAWYYLTFNASAAQAVASGQYANAFEHFLLVGQQAGFRCSPFYEEAIYLNHNPDVAAGVQTGVWRSGLEHFLAHGQREGRTFSHFYDEALYLRLNPDVANAVQSGAWASGIEHFLAYGQREGRPCNLLFSEAFYLQSNPDVATGVQAGDWASGFEHYLVYGQQEGRHFSPLFDEGLYLAYNPDVAAGVAGGVLRSGAEHYLAYGLYEQRHAPAVYFESYYLQQNPDVAAAVPGLFPTGQQHFLDYGFHESRRYTPYFNEAGYLQANPDVAPYVGPGRPFISGLRHYILYGQFEGRSPHPGE